MKKHNRIEEKLAASLTANTPDLLPYLPYLLQDIWALGSDPGQMFQLISEHLTVLPDMKLLDLGCGKGAVTVFLCRELGIYGKGIDLIPDFIEVARKKAFEYGVTHLCEFEIQDINEAVILESGFDLVILGAVGDVLGEPAETLKKLKNVIRKGGYILIDDAYLAGQQTDVKYQNYEYLTLPHWQQIFKDLDIEVIAQSDSVSDSYDAANDYNNRMIRQRANELGLEYPDKRDLFLDYVKSQEAECADLSETVVGVTWLLKAN